MPGVPNVGTVLVMRVLGLALGVTYSSPVMYGITAEGDGMGITARFPGSLS